MTRDDAFTARNRLRIPILILLATVNYWLAIVAAAVATTLTITIALLAEGGDIPTSGDGLKILGFLIAAVVVLSIVVGTFVALFRLPFQRRRLERQVLAETQARIATPDDHPQVRNLLDGLAIAAGTPVPRFAVIDDPAPNSFSVGTRPAKTIVAVTTGLAAALTRDELEAILAYEVSRIGSWDVALASWTVALTGGAIAASDSGDDEGSLRTMLGWLPRLFAQWIQTWALRDQAQGRDRAAISFTRHPAALIRALEKLDADQSQVSRVSRATAPLWVEFPTRLAGESRAGRRLARELGLSARIEPLRELAALKAPATD